MKAQRTYRNNSSFDWYKNAHFQPRASGLCQPQSRIQDQQTSKFILYPNRLDTPALNISHSTLLQGASYQSPTILSVNLHSTCQTNPQNLRKRVRKQNLLQRVATKIPRNPQLRIALGKLPSQLGPTWTFYTP